jgi:hypothetical protein
MSLSDWIWVVGFVTVLFGPFVVPLVARWVFRHQGVWLYRIAMVGRWLLGGLVALLILMDVEYFLNSYGPDQPYFDRRGFVSSMILGTMALLICWAPWGRILDWCRLPRSK